MPPLLSALNPRLSFSLKPFVPFLSVLSRAKKFPILRQSISAKPRTFSSFALGQLSAIDNGSRSGGKTGALSPSPLAEEVQRIDVNPPKRTRDFPSEDTRLRNWFFNHFREISRLFGFEEVDYPVLESEALFIRRQGRRLEISCIVLKIGEVALRPELMPSLGKAADTARVQMPEFDPNVFSFWF